MVIDGPVTQTVFGGAVGISQQAVSDLLRNGTLDGDGTAAQWLLAYCHRLREQAAGRMGSEVGGLDLAQERAALAREQRQGIAINNAVKRGEYASIGLLSEVLAGASQAVAERFDHLPGQLRKACPDLPPAVIDQVMAAIASARKEWVRKTVDLVMATVVSPEDDPADPADTVDLSDEPRAD